MNDLLLKFVKNVYADKVAAKELSVKMFSSWRKRTISVKKPDVGETLENKS